MFCSWSGNKRKQQRKKKKKQQFLPKTREEEGKYIQNLIKKHSKLIKGNFWCLISGDWYQKWKLYIEQKCTNEDELEFPKPDQMDNSALIEENSKKNKKNVKKGLVENTDYILVHDCVYRAFEKLYGGGPIISKKVIQIGTQQQQKLMVQIYDLEYTIYEKKDEELVFKANIRRSRLCTHSDLFNLLSQQFSIKKNVIGLYLLENDEKGTKIEMNQTKLWDSIIQNGEKLLLEENLEKVQPTYQKSSKKKNSTYQNQRNNYGNKKNKNKYNRNQNRNYSTNSKQIGLTGLSNLGNTCFMNSGLQCLLNTPSLCEYFQSGKYFSDINKKNPLGMGGKLANCFSDLVKDYWSGRNYSISPRALKNLLGKISSQFIGYSQHDSHELISFLLDGLHEDLNRILEKPYIDDDSDDDDDDQNNPDLRQLAKKSWFNYKCRNDSFIVDIFQGMLYNCIECPQCSKITHKFDPLMYLSVPLPGNTYYNLRIFLIPKNRKAPLIEYKINSLKKFGVDGVLKEISKLTRIGASKLKLMKIYQGKIFHVFNNSYRLNQITDRDMTVAYELPDKQENFLKKIEIENKQQLQEEKESENPNENENEDKDEDEYEDEYEDEDEDEYEIGKPKEKKTLMVIIQFQILKGMTNTGMGFPVLIRLEEGKISYQKLSLVCESIIKSIIPNIYDDLLQKLKKEKQKGNDDNISNQNENRNGNSDRQVNNNNNNNNNMGKGKGKNRRNGKNNNRRQAKKRMNQMKNKENKIIGFGFKFNELNPLFRIVSLIENEKKNKNKNVNFIEKILDEKSKIVITRNCKFCIRFNPLIHQRYSRFTGKFNDYNIDQRIVKNNKKQNKRNQSKRITLEDCIDSYVQKEKLNENNKWYCRNCEDLVQAVKKFDLWKLPEILIFHLKRFTGSGFNRKKIDKFVEFPSVLDMKKYVIGPHDPMGYTYKLYAISNHFGGLGGGHYTAYAQNSINEEWYNFNDSSVSQVTHENNVKTRSAYVLFYRKIDPNELKNDDDEEEKKKDNNGNQKKKNDHLEKEKDKPEEKKEKEDVGDDNDDEILEKDIKEEEKGEMEEEEKKKDNNGNQKEKNDHLEKEKDKPEEKKEKEDVGDDSDDEILEKDIKEEEKGEMEEEKKKKDNNGNQKEKNDHLEKEKDKPEEKKEKEDVGDDNGDEILEKKIKEKEKGEIEEEKKKKDNNGNQKEKNDHLEKEKDKQEEKKEKEDVGDDNDDEILEKDIKEEEKGEMEEEKKKKDNNGNQKEKNDHLEKEKDKQEEKKEKEDVGDDNGDEILEKKIKEEEKGEMEEEKKKKDNNGNQKEKNDHLEKEKDKSEEKKEKEDVGDDNGDEILEKDTRTDIKEKEKGEMEEEEKKKDNNGNQKEKNDHLEKEKDKQEEKKDKRVQKEENSEKGAQTDTKREETGKIENEETEQDNNENQKGKDEDLEKEKRQNKPEQKDGEGEVDENSEENVKKNIKEEENDKMENKEFDQNNGNQIKKSNEERKVKIKQKVEK
ncbi:ubiquitin carboxyl-terminal hydrolase 11 [Anaeramoeba flamelloides]|uniref:ubiquitinyl hydrolase 1 n=1 Tax=Anaeramoeba flamelloides TaxID=1746091 RepID=A0ABQ8X7M6_9EUKA|nr:ubiquitin carboxyl-terminal hydrolase 11 [Anaeramoeba flamelloides]